MYCTQQRGLTTQDICASTVVGTSKIKLENFFNIYDCLNTDTRTQDKLVPGTMIQVLKIADW